ncbi:MAG: hypothetical protein SFZ03_08435 [Candidatus Melainabacteria bacterium]|nr:hypothetical protein [Candidatus Melainabacteria bacterium]
MTTHTRPAFQPVFVRFGNQPTYTCKPYERETHTLSVNDALFTAAQQVNPGNTAQILTDLAHGLAVLQPVLENLSQQQPHSNSTSGSVSGSNLPYQLATTYTQLINYTRALLAGTQLTARTTPAPGIAATWGRPTQQPALEALLPISMPASVAEQPNVQRYFTA